MVNMSNIIRSAMVLALFAVCGTLLVAITYELTREQIAENERLSLLKSLTQLLPAESYNNSLLDDKFLIEADSLLGTTDSTYAYPAKVDGDSHTILLTPDSQEGYTGTINILLAINIDGTVVGVRVLSHRETPGLGDLIEERRSNWIHTFAGRSLESLTTKEWQVKKDGGVFDQFTGATITPRAIVKAVHRSLLYFQKNRDKLLELAND